MTLESSDPTKKERMLGREISEPSVVIIDSLRLRRSCIARVLDQWSSAEGLTIASVAPVGLPSECELKANCRLVVLSIGGQSVADTEMLKTIESIHAILPDAPLVVMSDKDEPAEVLSAFRAGAMGFIPASLDPEIALRAFTFIVGGGSYFPPSALTSAKDCPPNQRTGLGNNGDDGDSSGVVSKFDTGGSQAQKLTARQQDVVNLLRNGLPNKVIARHLGMTEATVKVHVRQIMRKLGANNRTQVALCLTTLSAKNPDRAEPAETETNVKQVAAH